MRGADEGGEGALDAPIQIAMIFLGMWYYSKNRMQLGPLSQQELSQKARIGEVSSSGPIWKEGIPDRNPSGQMAEFQSSLAQPVVPPQIRQCGMGSVPIQQPAAYPVAYAGQAVPNFLWQSILVTVACRMPCGVVAIVHSAKVDGLVAGGDIHGAMSASGTAKARATVGAIIGGLSSIGVFEIMALGALNS
jgi:hypothetical protein